MVTRRLRSAFIGMVIAALALVPAVASADVGQPVDLGVGQNPNVTLEPDGTADIAFTGQGANSAELDYQAWSVTGNPAAKAVLDGDPYEYLGSVAMIDPATPIVVYSSRNGDGRFRRYTGIGDVNDQASWTPAADIGKLDTPHVVSG